LLADLNLQHLRCPTRAGLEGLAHALLWASPAILSRVRVAVDRNWIVSSTTSAQRSVLHIIVTSSLPYAPQPVEVHAPHGLHLAACGTRYLSV
jgi:hypothetical protein